MIGGEPGGGGGWKGPFRARVRDGVLENSV